MNTVKELVIKAVIKNELERFLKGDDGYKVLPHKWVQVSIPTDWTVIISQGIYKVYAENPEIKINVLFESTLCMMIEDDILSLYSATNLIFNQLIREHDNRAPFYINKNKVLPLLRKKLNEKEHELKQNFNWLGNGEKEGLWSEIKRLNSILKDETGMIIL